MPESLIAERDDLVRKRDMVRQELDEASNELERLRRRRKISISLMECPFCAETIKDEAIACKHCSRDLRVARPVILEIQQIVLELDGLRRELDRVNARLQRIRSPVRYFVVHAIAYVLIPVILLVAAHVLVTIVLNVTPLYLRLASVIIPLPFGLAIYARHKSRTCAAPSRSEF